MQLSSCSARLVLSTTFLCIAPQTASLSVHDFVHGCAAHSSAFVPAVRGNLHPQGLTSVAFWQRVLLLHYYTHRWIWRHRVGSWTKFPSDLWMTVLFAGFLLTLTTRFYKTRKESTRLQKKAILSSNSRLQNGGICTPSCNRVHLQHRLTSGTSQNFKRLLVWLSSCAYLHYKLSRIH